MWLYPVILLAGGFLGYKWWTGSKADQGQNQNANQQTSYTRAEYEALARDFLTQADVKKLLSLDTMDDTTAGQSVNMMVQGALKTWDSGTFIENADYGLESRAIAKGVKTDWTHGANESDDSTMKGWTSATWTKDVDSAKLSAKSRGLAETGSLMLRFRAVEKAPKDMQARVLAGIDKAYGNIDAAAK